MGTDDKPPGKSCNGEVSHQLTKGVKGAAGVVVGGGGGGWGWDPSLRSKHFTNFLQGLLIVFAISL